MFSHYATRKISPICKISTFSKAPKLPLTTLRRYCTDVRLFTYLNNKPFSYVLKIFNYDGLWENKKIPDKNQRFDWIKSIHRYRFVNIGWLSDINMFNSMIWFV